MTPTDSFPGGAGELPKSHFRALLNHSNDAIEVLDASSLRFLDLNETECLALGYTREELLSMSLPDVVPVFTWERHQGILDTFYESGNARFESVRKRKDGSTFPVEVSVKLVELEKTYLVCIVSDITQRKLSEQQLERHTRFYAALSQCNQAIVHLSEEMALFQELCRIAVEFGGMKTSWIAVVTEDTRRIQPVAWYGNETRFLQDMTISAQPAGVYSVAPTAIAIREDRAYWCQNLLQDEATLPWREVIHRAQWASSASLPLHRKGRVIGAFVLYSGEVDAFDELTRNLLEEMALDISFALDGFDREARRQQAQDALLESQAQLDLALRSAGMGVWRYDLIANRRHFDERTCQLLGIDPTTFSGTAEEFFEVIHPEDRNAVEMSLARTIEENLPYESDYRVMWKDGSIHYITSRGKMELDAQGRPWKINAILFEITEWKEAQKQINSLAFYDSLTELPNRRLLYERMQHALAVSARNGRRGAILFIDLDNFKTINDTRGHSVGDILLRQVASRLNTCVRQEDTVARIGGDEFVVMLENLSETISEAATQTQLIAEKILAALSRFYPITSYTFHCTCSVGIALFDGRLQSIDELLKQADIAMYQAKKSGRNTLRFFDTQMQEIVTARAALETELRSAIELNQFELYYQLQVDYLSRPIGAEALIRWNHPVRGLVSPLEFIPVLEETGLILPVGEWVLNTACAQLKRWEREERTRHLTLAINLSAKDFLQNDFSGKVRSIVQTHGILSERLKMELTESLLLEGVDDTIATMNALNQLGIQFALDDFGTGYSSLQYIKRLPLDQIKIDQSFVRDLVSSGGDRVIVRTIIAMAHSMNLEVIAEGVETQEQFQLLFQKGCKRFQGYLFGRPMPIEAFQRTL